MLDRALRRTRPDDCAGRAHSSPPRRDAGRRGGRHAPRPRPRRRFRPQRPVRGWDASTRHHARLPDRHRFRGQPRAPRRRRRRRAGEHARGLSHAGRRGDRDPTHEARRRTARRPRHQDAQPRGAPRRLSSPARRPRAGDPAPRRAVRAPGPRPRRRGDGRALRLFGARRPSRDRPPTRRPFRGAGCARGPRGRPRDPCRGHHRGRRDRVRLRRHRTAARGQPQLPALGHALGLLLRRPLPDRTRSALVRRRVCTCLGRRPRRLPRQCPPTRSGRGRKRRDLGPDRRHALRRAWRSPSGSSTRPGNDEQPHVRQRTLHVLRDDRRGPGRLRGRGRPFGSARDNVKHTDHSGRGPRARVPAAGRAARAPARLGRRRRSTAAATA